MSQILTVRELTDKIKRAVEGTFPFVWVGGEVTNVARPSSGHVYFSLKDGEAQLQCVWFRGNQRQGEAFDPLTGEVYENGPKPSMAHTLRDGHQIVCAGRLTVYAPRGGYQLLVEIVQESGLGRLHQAFEALKRKLDALGWFALARKRVLPENPVRVAVVTAPTGAAIHDFLRVASTRGTGCAIRLYPAPVQGEEAPARLVAAMQRVQADAWGEVLVLIRGGGSLEDLWAFNDERVVTAVYESSIPVLAGIGHEVDTSLADMVADVRAATPSHAAQLLWRERTVYAQWLDECELRLSRNMERRLQGFDECLGVFRKGLMWLSPMQRLERANTVFCHAHERLTRAMGPHRFDVSETVLERLTEKLLLTLPQRIHAAMQCVAVNTQRAYELEQNRIDRADRMLERLELTLDALNPERPLERGYALVSMPNGHFVRRVAQLTPGMPLSVRVRDGVAETSVTAVRADAT